jgi:hypothetical protein
LRLPLLAQSHEATRQLSDAGNALDPGWWPSASQSPSSG